MPKPYLLSRPSGLYARFYVPEDLQPCVGSRYLVRPLAGLRGDRARLLAETYAVTLAAAFQAMREGEVGMVDVKKLLEDAKRAQARGEVRPWTAKELTVGPVQMRDVTVNGQKDTEAFVQAINAMLEVKGAQAFASPSVAVSEMPPSPLLSEEIASHVADLERRQLAPDTITESKHTLRILQGVIGDIEIKQIKPAHIRLFWEGVRWWPANATVKPRFKGLSVEETIAQGRALHVPSPSRHTLNKHRQRLSVFFNALEQMQVIDRSPLRGTGPEISTERELETGRPFTDEELRTIFDPANFLPWASKYPHRWWGPILGLYTGARVNEVAQLYLDDIKQVDGVWGLFIWKNDRNQKIKTKSSIRFVPLAQPVLDAGFLQFVEDMRKTGHPRLFPHLPAGTRKDGTSNGLGYGRQLSRQFAAYLKTLGLEKGVGFHAFRHTLSTKLAEACVDVEVIARITGHARTERVSVLERHYIHIADLKTLGYRVKALGLLGHIVGIPSHFWANANTRSRISLYP